MNTSTEKQNTIAAMRDALDNSNGLLEELALIGEWGESARGQIAENNAALSAAAENSLAVGDATKLRKALEELVYNIEMRAAVFDIFSIVDRKTFLDAQAVLKDGND